MNPKVSDVNERSGSFGWLLDGIWDRKETKETMAKG